MIRLIRISRTSDISGWDLFHWKPGEGRYGEEPRSRAMEFICQNEATLLSNGRDLLCSFPFHSPIIMTIMVIMKQVSVAELKARLSEYLAAVKRGENLVVTEHGKPIARLAPLERAAALDARMAELVKAGLANAPTAKLPREFFTRVLPPDPDGSIVQAIIEEREEGW